jgi:hypothetical protein
MMTIDELETFQRKYPFKHTQASVVQDRKDLNEWACGWLPLPALLASLAKHNGWKDVPEGKQFTEYIATLGYRRHE